jgi:hypothetical protein
MCFDVDNVFIAQAFVERADFAHGLYIVVILCSDCMTQRHCPQQTLSDTVLVHGTMAEAPPAQ